MAQPSIAYFFTNRKRAAIDDVKINKARKVLILDSKELPSKISGLSGQKEILFTQVSCDHEKDGHPDDKLKKFQDKVEKISGAKVVSVANLNVKPKNTIKASRTKKLKPVTNNTDIQELFNKMNHEPPMTSLQSVDYKQEIDSKEESDQKTPTGTPTKINAMDKINKNGPSLKEIKNKMTRSSRLAELKASMSLFQEADKKLNQIEKVTSQIPESPKLKGFKTIQLELMTSPQKRFSPEKAYLSPRKSSEGVRKNLFNLSSPTKNAIAFHSTLSPSKQLFAETSKPALTLPFKYRFLAEIFRSIDTVIQIMFNRKETITFRKLKPAVEEMLKRNLMKKHLAQIKTIFPEAFHFSQEKLRIFGTGSKTEQWELVVQPNVGGEIMTSEILLARRRKLFAILLDKVKDYHQEFLASLDTPLNIPKDKITRWHPEFDIEKIPDIEMFPLPQPPAEDKLTSGKDVLERARILFSCNTKMENALHKLKEAEENQTPITTSSITSDTPQSVLKGIPKALLEKVRQKQAAKALISMTRSTDKEKEVQLYSRLPELARLTRNLFVAEKKGVLPLDIVVEKLGNCYKGNLIKSDMEEHLKVIAKELPNWLAFHDLRNSIYLKLNKNADLSLVLNKLEGLCKQKNET